MYFEQKGITPKKIMDAKKEKIDSRTAWELLQTRKRVHIGKGKRVFSLDTDAAHKEEILSAVMGRSGNLRAPAIKTKRAFFIGYKMKSMGRNSTIAMEGGKYAPRRFCAIPGGHDGSVLRFENYRKFSTGV